MALLFEPFSDGQARPLVSHEQLYQVWMEAEQVLQAAPYDLRRKAVAVGAAMKREW